METGDTCNITVTGARKDTNAKAGTESYTATAISLDNRNYKLPESNLTQTFTIVPAELEIEWSNPELTYNGDERKPTATPKGMVNGETVTVSVSGGQVNANREGTSYTATASVSDKNYVIKEGHETTSFTIQPKTLTGEMVSLSGGTLEDESYEYAFTGGSITPAVAASDGGKTLVKDTDYILSGDTSKTAYGDYTLSVEGRGNYTGTVEVKWNITDPNAPAATISLSTNQWNTFWNAVTFGYFFKETQSVTVSGTNGENESGVEDVFYYTTETPVDDPAKLSGVEWTEIRNGGSFSIEPNQKLYIYAKVTDHAGNTAIVNSDGIVVYTDAAQVTEELVFTCLGDNALTASVSLNGNTIKEIECDGDSLTVSEDYTVGQNAGSITFQNSWLRTLAVGEYTLTTSYNPMGEEYPSNPSADSQAPNTTEITLKVQRSAGAVTDISDLSKHYDGNPVEDVTYKTSSTGKVTVEYKEKGAADDTYTGEKPTAVGEYTVRVTAAEDENYSEASAAADFSITYLEAPEGAYTLLGTKGENEWYISDVTLTPTEGYTVAESLNGTYVGNILLTESTGQDYKIYLKNEAGQMTDGILVSTVKIDKDDPALTVSGRTGEYLQEDTLQIEAQDDTSGLVKVEVKKDGGEFQDITASWKDGYKVAENGTYIVRATDEAGRSEERQITYRMLDSAEPAVSITAETDDGKTYTDGSWTNRTVTLKPENTAGNLGATTFQYKADDGQWQDYSVPITVADDTDADGVTYTFQAESASGVKSEETSITVKRDTVSPEGEIHIQKSAFRQLLNAITFGVFFNDDVDVIVTGTDALSEVASIQYFRGEEEVEEIQDISEWTDYKGAVHETAVDEERFVYYAKVTDHAGNETVFNSNGAVFDVTAPAIYGVVSGGTYYTTRKVTVSDVRLESVILNGSPAQSNTFILQGNQNKTYTITATDKAGNQTEYIVTMKPIADLKDPIEDLTTDNVTSQDKTDIEQVKKALQAVDTSYATAEEKAELEEILAYCDELLQKLEEIRVESVAQTGDDNRLGLWILLIIISGSILLVLPVRGRKERK